MRTADDVIADEILGRLPHGKTVSVGHHRRVVFAILCEVATYLSIRSDAPDDLKVNFISVLDEVMAWESDSMKEHGLNRTQASLLVWMSKYQHQVNDAIKDSNRRKDVI